MAAAIDSKVGPAALTSTMDRRVEAQPVPAFDALYDETFALVWRTLQRLGVPPAALDDAAQEVFVVVHRRLRQLADGGGIRAWVVGITVRVASDARRGLRRRGEHVELDEGLRDAAAGPHERAELSERRRVVQALLDGLPQEQREVFVLAEMEQLTGPEIADALGTKLNTVYSRLRLAREAFEARLLAYRARQERP